MDLVCALCFWVANGSTCLCVLKLMSAALMDGVSLVSILQAGDWVRVSTQARDYFSTYITTTD